MARAPVSEDSTRTQGQGRRWQRPLARLVVTVLCFAELYHLIDPAELWHHLSLLTTKALLIALVLHTLIILLLAWRWHSIVGALGGLMGFCLALRQTFVTTALNLVLPLSVGGDLGRVWWAHGAGVDVSIGITAAILDRVVGLVALGLLVMVAAMLLPAAFLPWEGRLLMTALLPAMLAGLWLLPLLARQGVSRWPALQRFAGMLDKVRSLLRQPRSFVLVLTQSFVGHLFAIICAVVIARGLHLELSFYDALLLFPVVLFAGMLPFSIGGWGVREAAAISIFSLAGMPAGGALALSLLFGLTQLAISGLGALVLLGWSGATRNGVRP